MDDKPSVWDLWKQGVPPAWHKKQAERPSRFSDILIELGLKEPPPPEEKPKKGRKKKGET